MVRSRSSATIYGMDALAAGLQQAVYDELRWDPSVDAGGILVAANGGTIRLTGSVHSFAQKRAAERAAQRTSGVCCVLNELQVVVHALDGDPDEAIASMAFLTLKWDANLPEMGIKASVRRACVTLTGEVQRQWQRDAAELAVAKLRGVRSIVNCITVKPAPIVCSREAIEAAIRRSAETNAKGIYVDVRGDTVTLRGTVRSWAECQDAVRAAWSAPGIATVDNRIAIV
jgi:osmotically-inducible protein OsmY